MKMIQLSLNGSKITIMIGMNANENWEIIETMKRNDYWVHMKHKPSSHAVVRIPKKLRYSSHIVQNYLEHAARMICHQSYKRIMNDTSVDFIYSPGKYVKKGNEVGEAILSITPDHFQIENPM